jgi:hypothetical protein
MERGSDQAKREAREQVPSERVKDPAAVARELRWRVRIAAGNASDDEDSNAAKNATVNGHAVSKRKREDVENIRANGEEASPFKNFKPRLWDSIVEKAEEGEVKTLKGLKPENEGEWTEHWIDWKDDSGLAGEEGEAADVNRRRHVVVKVRKTEKGVERQRVERVVEEWVWKDSTESLENGRVEASGS